MNFAINHLPRLRADPLPQTDFLTLNSKSSPAYITSILFYTPPPPLLTPCRRSPTAFYCSEHLKTFLKFSTLPKRPTSPVNVVPRNLPKYQVFSRAIERAMDEGVFIPSLPKALSVFLDEQVLDHAPIHTFNRGYWILSNKCPSQVRHILEFFRWLIMEAILGNTLEAMKDSINDTSNGGALRSIEACCAMKKSILEQALEQIDVDESWNICESTIVIKIRKSLNLPEEPLAQDLVVGVEGRVRSWLISSAMQPRALFSFSQRQVETLTRLVEPRVSYKAGRFTTGWNGRGLNPSAPNAPDLFEHLFRRHPELSIRSEDLPHMFYHLLRVAMFVADTWEAFNRPRLLQNGMAVEMPPYNVYKEGFHRMDGLWKTVMEDPWSPIPPKCRWMLADINLKCVWDIFWWMGESGQCIWQNGHIQSLILPPRVCHVPLTMEFLKGTCGLFAPHVPRRTRSEFFMSRIDWEYIAGGKEGDVPSDFRPAGLEWIDCPPDIIDAQNVVEEDYEEDPAIDHFYGLGQEYDPMDDDDDLFPIGPRIEISEFTTRIPSPTPNSAIELSCTICGPFTEDGVSSTDNWVQINQCNHAFHHHCLDRQVNSGALTSGRCPNCRAFLCERRENGVQVMEDEDSHEGTGASTQDSVGNSVG